MDLDQCPPLSKETLQVLMADYLRTHDPKVEARLVTSFQRLVAKMAREHAPIVGEISDLVQEGNLGLLRALRRYDPTRGASLASYAVWWIRAYQLRFVMANHRLVKIGTTAAQRRLFFTLRGACRRLEAAGLPVTDDRLALALHAPIDQVGQMRQRLSAREASIDASRDSERGGLVESLSDPCPAPDVAAEGAELRTLLHAEVEDFRGRLSGRDRQLFDARFCDGSDSSLQALARRFGISRERTRQLERRLLERLRRRIDGHLGPGAFGAAA